jgi:hypothetical protein
MAAAVSAAPATAPSLRADREEAAVKGVELGDAVFGNVDRDLLVLR